jgi:hypothetical protein
MCAAQRKLTSWLHGETSSRGNRGPGSRRSGRSVAGAPPKPEALEYPGVETDRDRLCEGAEHLVEDASREIADRVVESIEPPSPAGIERLGADEQKKTGIERAM